MSLTIKGTIVDDATGATGNFSTIVTLSTPIVITQLTAPIVKFNTIFAKLPVSIGQVIGTVPFTGGTPTSWAITSGDPNKYFAIDNKGQITVTAAGILGIKKQTYSILCVASNSAGTSSMGGLITTVRSIGGSGAIISINLSGTSLSNIGAQNAGAIIGAITITTSPPGGIQSTPVVLGGTDAAKFSITNGGIIPCNLIAAIDIPAGSYSITLTVT